MLGFTGQYDYTVDAKGRVALPARLRRSLNPEAQDGFVLLRGIEPCIWLFPLDVWAEKEAEFRKLNTYQTEARNMLRSIFRWMEQESLDAQGRIMIPKRLKEYAQVSDKVTIIGAMDRIEIWNPDLLDQATDDDSGVYGALIERVMGHING